MNNPWAFGWTHVLTILGFLITVSIAVSGFRSFGRWRREQLESKRIDIAVDALTLAYKAKFVFEHIRSPMASGGEWADMPEVPDDTPEKRPRRGSFYAVFKRIERNKDFFDAVWELQPRFMAVFGPETESIFLELHKARVDIEVAAQMLFEQALEPYRREEREDSTRKLYEEMRGDIWGGMNRALGRPDGVAAQIEKFKGGIDSICLPLLRELRREPPNKAQTP